ncbi:MAG: DNA polymerase III subunit delta [Hyphomicrobiales bacterium]
MVSPRAGRLRASEGERVLRGPSSGLAPITLAAGADDFLRDRVVRAFREGGDAEGAEFQRLEGDDVDAETLAGALATLSLFAGSRRIWLREAAKLDAACEAALFAWADGTAEGARVLVTTAREPSELKTLERMAARAAVIDCDARAGETERWMARLLEEAGLTLPPGAGEAIARSAGSLLAASQEVQKLRALAGASGKVTASSLGALRGARAGGSLDRWADAVLAGDVVTARREAAALDAEGASGTSALWVVAERALAALDPQAFAWRRGPAPSVRLTPGAALAALDAVYAADRGLKRGAIRDSEIRDAIEFGLRGVVGA